MPGNQKTPRVISSLHSRSTAFPPCHPIPLDTAALGACSSASAGRAGVKSSRRWKPRLLAERSDDRPETALDGIVRCLETAVQDNVALFAVAVHLLAVDLEPERTEVRGFDSEKVKFNVR